MIRKSFRDTLNVWPVEMSAPQGSGPCSFYWGRHIGRRSIVPMPSPAPLCRDESHCWRRLWTLFPKLEPTAKHKNEALSNCWNGHYKFILSTISFQIRRLLCKMYIHISPCQCLQTYLQRTWGVHHLSCSTRSDGQDTHGLCSEASGRRAAWECLSHLKMRLVRVAHCNNYHGINTKGKTEGMKTRSQQTFIIPYRHMLSKHTVKSSLFVFDNTIQYNPRQNREEIRLLGIVGNGHAEINQLKHNNSHTIN